MVLGSIINNNQVILKLKMKVKVRVFKGTRVHGIHIYLCFLVTKFGKLFQNEAFFIFLMFNFNAANYIHVHLYSIY